MINYKVKPILIIVDLETRPQRRFQIATIIITDLRQVQSKVEDRRRLCKVLRNRAKKPD